MSVADLQHPPRRTVACAVLTISDTRTPAADSSGQAIQALLEAGGHVVVERRLLTDDPADITAPVAAWAAQGTCRAIITTGGTGIARRDVTVEALEPLFSVPLPGFGEIFRRLSYDAIGPAAMLSRATAGVIHRSVVFVLPGSEPAVRLAMTELVLPQLTHVISELDR